MKRKLSTKIILAVLLISILSSSLSVFVSAEGGDGLGENTSEHERISALARSYGCTDPITKHGPQITFLIHGLGGDASNWSNDYYRTHNSTNFAYNKDLLLARMGFLLKSTIVARSVTEYEDDYWTDDGTSYVEGAIKEGTGQKYKLYELLKSCTCYEEDKYDCKCNIVYDLEKPGRNHREITEVSYNQLKGNLNVVFEASDPKASNRQVYEEFSFIANRIIDEVKVLNYGFLPRINLIAHGRGGLTAMQYALDYPYLVDTLVTIGTPFSGSNLKSEALLNLFNLSADPKNSELFSFGAADLNNKVLTDDYRNRWNSEYKEKYSHIKFHAIGSYATTDALVEIIANSTKLGALYNKFNLLTEPFDAIMEALTGAWIFNNITVLLGDIMVSLPSQLAKGFTGVERRVKVFLEYNIDFDMRSYPGIPIPHNVIVGDYEINNHIYDMFNRIVSYDYLTVWDDFDDCIKDGVLEYPSFNYGPLRDEIPSYQFNNMDEITSVVIPASVKKIGPGAFRQCKNLKSVTFAEGSLLEEISYNAFEGCVSLETFEPGDNLIKIDHDAFRDCKSLKTINTGDKLEEIGLGAFSGSSLESFYIGKSVKSIGYQAFFDIPIAEFRVSDDNHYFCASAEGALFSNDMDTLIAFPVGSTHAYFTAPAQMTDITPGAFYNAKNLVQVDLGSLVTHIPKNAFCGCEALGEIIAPNVSSVAPLALENTAFMESEQPIKSLGTVFIKYTGNDETVSISGYDVINSYAFEGCTSLKSIKISGISLYIQPFAFSDCVDLTEVYLEYYSTVRFREYAFAPETVGRKIFVNAQVIDEYTAADSMWESYHDEFVVYEGKITFDSGDGTEVESLTVEYGESGILLPESQKPHYHFVGWSYDPSDETEFVGTIFNAYSEMIPEIKLYAVWEPTIYILYLDTAGGAIPGNEYGKIRYTVEDAIELPNPTREGYIFVGWKNSEGKYVTGFPVGTHGDVTLTAEWDAIEYEVELFNGNTYIDTIIATYEDRSYIEELISVGEENAPNGYYFDGWYYLIEEGREYVISVNSEESTSIYYTWDFVKYNTLYADYKPERYYLTIEDKESGLFSVGVNSDGSTTQGSDGDGFMISGLTIKKNSNSEVIGMFGTNVGTVRNLTVHGSTLTLSDTSGSASISAGIVVGLNKGTLEYVGTSSCTVSTTRSASSIGGMVGKNYYGNILYCIAQTIHISGIV